MGAGTYTAIVTPFRDGRIDETALAALVDAQVVAGIDGLVAVGTTGESPTLDHDEHVAVIGSVTRRVAGRVKVIAGTGSNSTREAIELTRRAEDLGVDGALLVAPYYNKPTQEGLYRHYAAVAGATRLPLTLYSIPGRCGVEIGVETVARLAVDCPNIVAIKEAGGSVERVSQLRQALPQSFEIFSGDDSLTWPFLAVGAVGVVSVASNVVPVEVAGMVRAFLDGRHAEGAAAHARLYRLFRDLFVETNPVPVKAALEMLGRMSGEVRLPLCPLAPASRERLAGTLRALGLIRE